MPNGCEQIARLSFISSILGWLRVTRELWSEVRVEVKGETPPPLLPPLVPVLSVADIEGTSPQGDHGRASAQQRNA